MPKKKEPDLAPAEQFKRFREAAKKAGVSDREQDFVRAFKVVAPIKTDRGATARKKK